MQFSKDQRGWVLFILSSRETQVAFRFSEEEKHANKIIRIVLFSKYQLESNEPPLSQVQSYFDANQADSGTCSS